MSKWQTARLGDVCEKVTDYVASGSFASLKENVLITNEENYAVMVKTADFSNGFTKGLTYTDKHGYEFLHNSNLFGGELILSNIGSIGKVFKVPYLDRPMTLASNSVMIKTETDELRNYLYYFFLSDIGYEKLMSISSGTSMKKFNKTELKGLEIPIPPLETQKRIAANLDKVTRTIDLCNAILEKLDLLVKARFVEMFGEPVHNTKNWNTEVLSKHLNVVGGYAFKSDLFQETGIPVLRIGNINAGYFRPVNMVYWEDDSQLDRYKMYAGDLVMSLTGTVGKDDYGNVCILGNDYDVYYLNQRNAKLELLSSLDKYYLSELLKFEEIKKKLTGISRGVRQANISNKDILNLCVPIPPIDLQQQFAAFVEQTDKSKSAVKQVLEKAETLKKALMQEYFG